MRNLSKRALAGAMALAMTLPLAVPAFAAAKTPYSISVEKNTLRIMDGKKVHRTYPLENTEIRLTRSTKNNLMVGFTKKGSKKETTLTIGAQDTVTVSGTLSKLTLSASLPADWQVVFSGKADTMLVDAPAKAILEKGAQVSTLQINHKKADVQAVSGAKINKTDAVEGVKVASIKKQTPAPNKTAVKPGKTTKTQKTKVSVDFEDRDEQKFTRSTGFDTDEIYLEARSGYPVGTAVRDVKITVYETDNPSRKVFGSWEFENPADADATQDKVYLYRFVPDDQERYDSYEIKLNFTGAGTQRGLTSPGLHFEDRSHGDGNFSIEVSMPYAVEDDDELYIYITDKDGKKVTERHSLSQSDAGETQSYALQVKGSSSDRFKIKVRIKRDHGSDSPYSDTITYEID